MQLRLTGTKILQIEKKLKKSLAGLFYGAEGGKIPPSHELLIVLQGANTISGVTEADVVEAFEKYIEDGHSPVELNEIVTELLDESGFFGKTTDGESEQEPNKEQEAASLLSNDDEIPTE